MSGFRLLGLVPLEGCNEKFYKNLTVGTPYKFNNDVIIELEDDLTKIKNVQLEVNQKTKDLYKLKNGISVEVSAIVGLNGSGKSALIELLYYSIYALSVHNKNRKLLQEHSEQIGERINKVKKDAEKINFKSSSSLDLFKVFNNNGLKLNKKDFKDLTNGQTLLKTKLKKHSEYLHAQENEDLIIERLIKKELAVGIVLETPEGVFSVVYRDEKIIVYKHNNQGEIESEIENFFFENFFYSICLNYSHHSLNSQVIGNWINSLFHKNDGYATPVVINPMREDGNFNINRELHLSNERIMSNLTYDVASNNEVFLLKKYELKSFLFKAKRDFTLIKCNEFREKDEFNDVKTPFTSFYDKVDFDKLSSVSLVRSVIGKKYLNKYTMYQDYALGYLEKKIDKIKNNYTNLFLDKNGNFNHLKFMSFLKTNKSHITKKLRQTINFIEKTDIEESIWNNSKDYAYKKLSLEDFRLWLIENDSDYHKLSPSALMNFALPGFFNIDFEISTQTGSVVKLSELSSGEQQMIFNINTITYHLYNLQSVHSESDANDKHQVERLAYKNISIILDEIEIYYHPDMQRELTYNILNSLENIKEKGSVGIEAIHLIYLTHSPFILSDVSSSNILRLNNGEIKTIKQQTFASNIHDLLANDFFLKEGSMGEYAKNEINNSIGWLNEQRSLKEKGKLDITNSKFIKDKKKYKGIIELIGERVLKIKLIEMLSYLEEDKLEFNEMIKNEISRLNKLIKD